MTPDEVARELAALGAFYGVKDDFVAALAPWLGSYAEIVLAEDGFEVLTGGKGCAEELGNIATRFGAAPSAIDRFRKCDIAFPARMLGLKVEPGASAVTLYVRLLAPIEVVTTFLRGIGGCPAGFPECLAPARTIYGLGFFTRSGESGIKTYTVTDLREGPGFLSYRLSDVAVLEETKVYRPEVELSAVIAPTARWREIIAFVSGSLALRTCTVGLSRGVPSEMKLYFERIGAVPNDFTAR